MTTKNNEIDEGLILKTIIKEVKENGHVCIDDRIEEKDIRRSIKKQIVRDYRKSKELFSLTYLEKLFSELAEVKSEYDVHFQNDYKESIDTQALKKSLQDAKQKKKQLEEEIMKEYFRNSNDFDSYVLGKGILNNSSEKKVDELNAKLKKINREYQSYEMQMKKVEKAIDTYNNSFQISMKKLNEIENRLTEYTDFVYIINKNKLYLYSQKYEMKFLDNPVELQEELKKLRTYQDLDKANDKLTNILKYGQYIYNAIEKSKKSGFTEAEYKKFSLIINEFLKWGDSVDLKINSDKWTNFYRGHSNSNYSLRPSISRVAKHKENEHLMFREIQINNSNEIQNTNEILEKLAAMQHYSLPTRLLDITSSILTAIYFAVESNKRKEELDDSDGEIIVYKVNEHTIKYYDSDSVEILSALVLLSAEDKKELLKLSLAATLNLIYEVIRSNDYEQNYKSEKIRCIEKFNQEKLVKRLSHEIQKNSGHLLEDIYPLDLLNSYFVKPKQNNIRIIKQQGAFIINGLIDSQIVNGKNRIIVNKEINNKEINNYNAAKHLWSEYFDVNSFPFERVSRKTLKYIIPSYAKEDFKDWLADLNVDEAAIYPDFEKIAGYLKGRYN